VSRAPRAERLRDHFVGWQCRIRADAMRRKEQMTALLRELLEAEPDIEATAVVRIEGVVIASSSNNGLTDEQLAAMTAAMAGWGERIARELARGKLDQVVIRGDVGSAIMVSIDDETVLTALIRDEMQLGLMFLDMRRAAGELARLI
jgi:hypothetical protein